MSKQTSPKAPTAKPEPIGPNRADTFKTIAGRIRLIGRRRSPALRAVYNEAAALIEKAAK
jgi:hypothetical protein